MTNFGKTSYKVYGYFMYIIGNHEIAGLLSLFKVLEAELAVISIDTKFS